MPQLGPQSIKFRVYLRSQERHVNRFNARRQSGVRLGRQNSQSVGTTEHALGTDDHSIGLGR